jgi:ribA/ribD-fused uncharacterized protein
MSNINKYRRKTIIYHVGHVTYGGFCAHSNHPINLKGKEWVSVWDYYQAQKFADTPHEEMIRIANVPYNAIIKAMNELDGVPRRREWNKIKEGVMMDAMRAKFTQYRDLRQLLVSTNDARLVAKFNIDYYLTIGWTKDDNITFTKERLGACLERVRTELRCADLLQQLATHFVQQQSQQD